MQIRKRSGRQRLFTAGAGLLAVLPGLVFAQTAQAQRPGPTTQDYARNAIGFLSTGGYFITGSARHAIGSTKFMSQAAYYVRPKHFGNFQLTGGLEVASASDHFFPFTSGDNFSLIGPAVRLSTVGKYDGFRPFVSAGLFYGQLRSEQMGFDRGAFTPSIAVGADYKFARYFTLSASYRVAQDINGFSPDGFGLYLRIF